MTRLQKKKKIHPSISNSQSTSVLTARFPLLTTISNTTKQYSFPVSNMVNRSDAHYFGAGPAPLPTAVLERASQVLLNYKDKGIGLCEISHRSPDANEILADAKQALTTLLDIPDDYEILFLQSGGHRRVQRIGIQPSLDMGGEEACKDC